MKRLLGIATAAFVMTALFLTDAHAEKKIGVLLWTKENHYTETLRGIMDELANQGFGEKKAKFSVENAEGNKAKAMDLAKKLARDKMDLVIAIGTFAAVAVSNEIKDVPVVFGMVWDPLDLKIIEDWKSSGNNTTGSSVKFPLSQILTTLKQLVPVKRLGVLYQPGEKNSESYLRELQKEQNNSQVKVVPVPVTRKEEVAHLVSEAAGAVDALYICGSTIIGETLPTIVEVATKAKLITVSNLQERIEKGVLLGVCADSHETGLIAGEKAVKVLKGAKPSSIPIGLPKKLDVIVNMKTAKAMQLQISPAFMKTITKTLQ